MTSRWLMLRCEIVQTTGRGSIWRLDVGALSHVNWTWEGAAAIGAVEGRGFDEGDERTWRWRGIVVEADEVSGRLYVEVLGPEPTPGALLIRPYAFLASLHKLYNDPLFVDIRPSLSRSLSMAMGHGESAVLPPEGLARLQGLTRRAWSILWGPPGTGKTWTIGRQVAAMSGRILVVSTTNKATDGVALSIAEAHKEPRRIMRIGSGAELVRYQEARAVELLVGGETGLRRQLVALREAHQQAARPEERASLSARMQRTRRALESCSREVFLEETCQVVITTAFNALRQVIDPDIFALLESDHAPFDTVIIDEAGLVSRAAVAALSLLAARRLMLVGDPRQLAPIAKMSRALPPAQAAWLAESALAHLTPAHAGCDGVMMLTVQHRMHPEVRAVVSAYQYDNQLTDGPSLPRPGGPDHPRALWMVLDEDTDAVSLRAERGPGGRSRIRRCTPATLERLLGACPWLEQAEVLFLTPFAAQARAITGWLSLRELPRWSASTVHRQQGAEADCVIFDTVDAGSAAWPPGEWKRLINVGLSRARECLVLLASREEMAEPWMRGLALTPAALRTGYPSPQLVLLPSPTPQALPALPDRPPHHLGAQLARWRGARPILSAEQERLCRAPLDGGPRLVRGVAGSGKTLVLAHWLARTVADDAVDGEVWVVYGNRALRRLLVDRIEDAWRRVQPGSRSLWGTTRLWHIRELLRALLPEVGLRLPPEQFDYDMLCKAWLEQVGTPRHRCGALFIDEAQDLGPETLRMLSALVAPTDPERPRSRPVMIFYDHDQNVYGRRLPQWSELGLDVRGRAVVMKEAYRSTRPIAELALNTLYRLRPPARDPSHRELVRQGLIVAERRGLRRWWAVRSAPQEGPSPILTLYPDRAAELSGTVEQLTAWIAEEGVRPQDVVVLCNSASLRAALFDQLAPALADIGFRAEHRVRQPPDRNRTALLISTPHSFKGYDAEVVVVVGLDRFATPHRPLPAALYVAMTRARSLLVLSGLERVSGPGAAVIAAASSAVADLTTPPALVRPAVLDRAALIARLGTEHLAWLAVLWGRYPIHQEPLTDADGGALARPLFWFSDGQRRWACFDEDSPDAVLRACLEDAGVVIIQPGDPVSLSL